MLTETDFSDLAVPNSNSGSITILLGSATGAMTVAAGNPISAGLSPNSIAAGDFNSDGNMDLLVSNAGSTLLLFVGDGKGGFTASTGPTVPPSLTCTCLLRAGQFTKNGPLDVVVLSQTANSLVVMHGDGAGHFTAGKLTGAGNDPVAFEVGDINGDGNPDLAVANYASGVTILFGDGQGNFTPGPFVDQFVYTALALGDMNGDGYVDLITPYMNSFKVSPGDDTGTFTAYPWYFEISNVYALTHYVVGDFNGDGLLDFAATDGMDNKIVVFLGLAKNPDSLGVSPNAPEIAVGAPVTLNAGVTVPALQVPRAAQGNRHRANRESETSSFGCRSRGAERHSDDYWA
jgi:hypothetical protein